MIRPPPPETVIAVHRRNMVNRHRVVPVTLATIGGVDYTRIDGKPPTVVDTMSRTVTRLRRDQKRRDT